MDYAAFYRDVVRWIEEANKAAATWGMSSEQFWQWVADSCGAMTRKYQDHPLVIKQMMMLAEWMEEVYEKSKG